MVSAIRNVESALGEIKNKTITQGEKLNRQILGKSMVPKKALPKGTVLTKSLLEARCPGTGIPPIDAHVLVGKKLLKNIEKGQVIFPNDLSGLERRQKKFNIPLAWGIPIRLHDARLLTEIFSPEFVEFHPSYEDLKLETDGFLNGLKIKNTIFHCPELISNSELLNLASLDEKERQQHVQWFKSFLEHCEKIRTSLSVKIKSKIIINVGGFSVDQNLDSSQINRSKSALQKSFAEIGNTNFELLPQTMPPFPWHFGGQRFHNLFIDPIQIKELAELLGCRICFDTSHTKLACNEIGFNFDHAVDELLPITSHIHLSDADNSAGEGLQFGHGELDLAMFMKHLKKHDWKGTLIPEVWQGHLNAGQGFHDALLMIQNELSSLKEI